MSKAHSWSSGELLQFIREEPEISRSELARLTGLSPTTIATRIAPLLELGYVREDGTASGRGRKPRPLALNPDWGIVLVVHLGSRHTRIGLVDATGTLLSVEEHAVAPAGADADEYLTWLGHRLDDVLGDRNGRVELRGIGISIPAPVDIDTAELVAPVNFPGWSNLAIVPRLQSHYGVPVVVDNDVTLMALGEHRMHRSNVDDLLYVKLGSANGCGIVVNGAVYRGTSGGAGEIAHMTVVADEPRRCPCGRDDCLEANFGGAALIERLRAQGREVSTTADIIGLVERGDPAAVEIARTAGSQFGSVLGVLVEVLSPAEVVLGGRLAQLGVLTSALRAGVYARAHPIAVRTLSIDESVNGANASILGAGWLIIDSLLAQSEVDAEISRRD